MAIKFDPGFRISLTDAVFLLVACVGAAFTFDSHGSAGYIVITPAVQFFLFCNVFRIRRVAELIWAGLYLAGSTAIYASDFSLKYSMLMGLVLGALIIAYELRHPSYHGIFWEKINPSLKSWFDKNIQ